MVLQEMRCKLYADAGIRYNISLCPSVNRGLRGLYVDASRAFGWCRSMKALRQVDALDDDDMADVSVRGGNRLEQHSVTQQGEKSVGLRCLTPSPDGHVYAGFHSGHLKCYTALGRLVWKKVCFREFLTLMLVTLPALPDRLVLSLHERKDPVCHVRDMRAACMATLLACSCSGMEACHWCKPRLLPCRTWASA